MYPISSENVILLNTAWLLEERPVGIQAQSDSDEATLDTRRSLHLFMDAGLPFVQ